MLHFSFFFQAEDGIRDYKVTGVQTCALPISLALATTRRKARRMNWTSARAAMAPANAASAIRPISRTRIVQSWDVAMMTGGKNDYSACTTWLTHKNDAYLLHVYRGRLEYPELRRK